MKKITKIQNDVTPLNEAGLNPPLYDLEERTDYLENLVFSNLWQKQNLSILNAKVKNTITNYRVVYFDGTQWDTATDPTPLGENISTFPTGIVSDIKSDTGTIWLRGCLQNIDKSITEDNEVIIGSPYYLSLINAGKITLEKSTTPIYIGQFIDNTTFVLDTHVLSNSHVHKRLLLTNANWENHTTYFLYPTDDIGQIPLPYRGLVMVINGTFIPYYGTYEVDIEGIKITDITYFETALELTPGTLAAFLLSGDTTIEIFYSDPFTLSVPGVLSLESGTPNLVIEPKTPSQEGYLVISNIPEISFTTEAKESRYVVKNISVSTSGQLLIERGPVVERLVAGNNTVLSDTQGTITVNSNSSKYQEADFTDIFLRGALSKLYANTIHTYIEYGYARVSGAIFKYVLPYNFDESKLIEIYASYFTPVSTLGAIPFNVKYSSPIGITDTDNLVNVELPVSTAFKIEKQLVTRINNVGRGKILYVSMERPIDSVYLSYIGLLALSVKHGVL